MAPPNTELLQHGEQPKKVYKTDMLIVHGDYGDEAPGGFYTNSTAKMGDSPLCLELKMFISKAQLKNLIHHCVTSDGITTSTDEPDKVGPWAPRSLYLNSHAPSAVVSKL